GHGDLQPADQMVALLQVADNGLHVVARVERAGVWGEIRHSERTHECVGAQWLEAGSSARHRHLLQSGLTASAGTPAPRTPGGMSRLTTLPAPITDPAPMVTPLSTVTRAPIQTRSPTTMGRGRPWPLAPSGSW